MSARTTEVFISNREYVVAFGEAQAVVEWWHERPIVGATGTYRIDAVLKTTHRTLLTVVGAGDP